MQNPSDSSTDTIITKSMSEKMGKAKIEAKKLEIMEENKKKLKEETGHDYNTGATKYLTFRKSFR
jgi:hypothetical protein